MRRISQGLLLFAALATVACDGARTSGPPNAPSLSTQQKVVGQSIARASAPAASVEEASVVTLPPGWDPVFGTNVSFSDDDCAVIPLGFTFVFYGISYTSVGLQSNGNVTPGACLNPGSPYGWNSTAGAPGDNANARIAPFYQDIDPPEGGTISWKVVGTAPSRRFVATWFGVEGFSCTACTPLGFQLTLFETTNAIQFSYAEITELETTAGSGVISGTGAFVRLGAGADHFGFQGRDFSLVPFGGTYLILPAAAGTPGGLLRGFGSLIGGGINGGASVSFVANQLPASRPPQGIFALSSQTFSITANQILQVFGSTGSFGGTGAIIARGICTGGPCVVAVGLTDAQGVGAVLNSKRGDAMVVLAWRQLAGGALGPLIFDSENARFIGSILVSTR